MGLLRPPPGRALENRGRGHPQAALRTGNPAGLQAGGHLRRGVRGLHALLLFDLRTGERGAPLGPAEGRHPGRRPQPDRPGHRVRLLLRARLFCAPRGGLREHHGQLEPGDGEHRLRHVGQALFRAGDAGGRPAHPGRGEADGRDRPVRRTDPAQSGPGPGGRRGADPRHIARRHRPGGGPEALSGDRSQAEPEAARQRHGHGCGRRRPVRRADRLPGRRAPFLRPGRPGHGDRLRHGGPAALHGNRDPCLPGPSDPHRQVSGGRHRSGRGRHQRRYGHGGGGHHGAHRRGRNPLRGQRLCAPAHYLPAGAASGDRGADPADCRRTRGRRAHEHSVCRKGRRPVRPRGQSAGIPHCALRKQGHRRPVGQAGDQGHDREDPSGAGLYRNRPSGACLRQRGGVPLQPFSECGHPSRTGDEIHRGGHGHRPFLRYGLRQVADGGGIQAAEGGKGVRQRA